MHRFFVPPESIQGEQVVFAGARRSDVQDGHESGRNFGTTAGKRNEIDVNPTTGGVGECPSSGTAFHEAASRLKRWNSPAVGVAVPEDGHPPAHPSPGPHWASRLFDGEGCFLGTGVVY